MEEQKRNNEDSGTIKINTKYDKEHKMLAVPTDRYLRQASTALRTTKKVVIMSRGKSNSRAIDISQALLNKDWKDQAKITTTKIGTEMITSEKDNKQFPVSTLEITVEAI